MATYVNKGLEMTVKLLNGVVATPMKYIATGSGSTAEGNAQTALVTENTATGMGRAEATCAYVANYQATWTHEWTNGSGGSVTVREVGIFDATPSGGNMLMRHVYSGDKVILDTESITIVVTFTQGRV